MFMTGSQLVGYGSVMANQAYACAWQAGLGQ